MRPPPHRPADLPSPRRRFGQNFLIDRSAVARIVDAVGADPGEAVVEIGPGRGALTGALVERAGRIAAVELDRDLAAHLRRTFGDRLSLFESDILRLDWDELSRALSPREPRPLVVVGNLPYNISKPVAMRMVDERERVDRAVLMFQREVADRIAARPGNRDYGAMTVLVALSYEVERLFDLPPRCFRPRPAVTSTVTRWKPRGENGRQAPSVPRLRRCLAASFARRRRTLYNNLRTALPGGAAAAVALLDHAGIDGELRPEALPPEEFLRLAEAWPDPSP